jgi:hypothetical protein
MKISLLVFKIQGFEGGIRVPKHGGPRNSTRVGFLNHQTSKFSPLCLMNQNLLMHVLNLRFRRGNWALNVWGTLEFPGALISNHRISIFSIFAYRVKICWWMFAIWGFEGGIGPPTFWGPQNFNGALISNHQTSKFSLFCLKSENLLVGVCNLRFSKVELDTEREPRLLFRVLNWGLDGGIGPHRVRDLKIPPWPRFQITKHLNLAILAQGTKCSYGCFEF